MKRYTLKELREKNNLTQKEVAERLKVNKNYISMIENGSRNPSDKMKNKLAKIYKCSIVVYHYKQQNVALKIKIHKNY